MGLVVELICLILSFVIQGSAGYSISPSPATFSATPTIGEGTPSNDTHGKQLRSDTPSPTSQPNGSVFHPPLVLAPPKSAPVPQTIKGPSPSLSPNTPTVLPPHSLALSPSTSQVTIPSSPPSAHQTQPPQMKDHVLVPKAPVPIVSPSRKSPQNPPPILPITPESAPPSPHGENLPDNEAPPPVPIVPVQIAPPPMEMLQNPPVPQPIIPQLPPPILPVPVASPPTNLPRNPPPIQPSLPEVPPSNLPVQVAPPPREMMQSSPIIPQVPPPIFPAPVASPPSNLPRNPHPVHPTLPGVPPSNLPEPNISPVSTPPPSFNPNRGGLPVAAPSNVMPKRLSPSPIKVPSVHVTLRPSSNAPPPLSVNNPPPHNDKGLNTSASLPPTSFHRHQHAKKNITSSAPLSDLVPPASTEQGPFTHPAPLHSPKLGPRSKQRHYAPPVLNPEHPISPAPAPSKASPSRQTKMPFLSPKNSPSGPSPRNPKMALLPPLQALPPPPPNEDCTSLTCTEPLTNTPPGSPCGCVWPMQVGLRLSVALYTFFPLVSELAAEISVGVFMKQSQVRIMGANAASQDPEKTVVLIDLVPLGEKIDNTTAYLIYQRFWHKQVVIRTSFFGDYEVLYVNYPGLPQSPPLPPSTINIISGDPYSGNDNNGRTIKPLGVDVNRQRHKDGLNAGVIAIIVLSASIAVILCCAIAWILLFKYRSRICQPEQPTATTVPSVTKSSAAAASMIGSGPNSISMSFGSSIAPYTGSAKTLSSSDVERATDNFNSSRILGEGGFGLVYSGVLEDGTKVAVKVLKRDDQQGGREFLAEVEMLSRLHHRNLVKLIGICTEERSRCLVYELIPNGSVESHLHGVDKDNAPLDWGSRMKIALGTARGLAYLHEDSSPRVIHRDFKSSNILLEHDFTPKVSDFGLARTALDEDNKHISTRVMGTFGYVAPEYAMTGHLLVKSDVYSYGVVLLELLTGRKPVDMSQPPGQENLVTWARPLLTVKESLESIIDPSLGPDFPFDSINKFAAIASMCVQPEVSHRPFMGEVVQALKLVCKECDEAKDLGSRSCSREDLSVDFDPRVSINSRDLPDPMQTQSPMSNYESNLDIERGLSVSDLFSSSAMYGRPENESFRRHSSSGPLETSRRSRLPLWKRMRRLSGGSVSEHGVLFRL